MSAISWLEIGKLQTNKDLHKQLGKASSYFILPRAGHHGTTDAIFNVSDYCLFGVLFFV